MNLERLADRYWTKAAEVDPTIATVRGVHDFDHLLPGLDDDWVADMSSAFRGIVEEATALDTEGMATQQRITRSL